MNEFTIITDYNKFAKLDIYIAKALARERWLQDTELLKVQIEDDYNVVVKWLAESEIYETKALELFDELKEKGMIKNECEFYDYKKSRKYYKSFVYRFNYELNKGYKIIDTL